jgi:hypothetical protein
MMSHRRAGAQGGEYRLSPRRLHWVPKDRPMSADSDPDRLRLTERAC